MKKVNLNFQPLNRHGQPHVIDTTCAVFLADILDRRINKERPALEARVANELASNGSFEVSEEAGPNGEASELVYIRSIVEQLDIDNLLKGQLLDKF